jgi:CheY-like chemotaxis protein
MPAILLIGEDEFLLETRAAVLRSTGADMVCTDVSEAIPRLEQKNFDLAVLCHSIPGPVCQTVIDVVRQNWPSTRILLVSAVRSWEREQPAEGVDVCAPDPEHLIECTIELLGRRKPGSVLTLVRDSSAGQVAGR